MKVKRWMTSPVITVTRDCPGLLAFRKMLENQIRRLVVVDDDDAVVGVITDRDLRGVAYAAVSDNASTELQARATELCVSDIMSSEVLSVTPETDVREAALLMHNRRLNGLPVMEGGKAVGMITVQDLMEILVAALDKVSKEKGKPS